VVSPPPSVKWCVDCGDEELVDIVALVLRCRLKNPGPEGCGGARATSSVPSRPAAGSVIAHGEVWSRGARGNTGTLLSGEAGSGAAGYMAVLEFPRQGGEVQSCGTHDSAGALIDRGWGPELRHT
jgi:hypothetical protein